LIFKNKNVDVRMFNKKEAFEKIGIPPKKWELLKD